MGYSKDSKAIWEKDLAESMTILRKCFGNKAVPEKNRKEHLNILISPNKRSKK